MEDVMKYITERQNLIGNLEKGDFSSILAYSKSLSNGVNEFPPPKLYTHYFLKEIEKNEFMGNYTLNSGHPILAETIKYYEKSIGLKNLYDNTLYANDISITAGATAAISFFFEYFSIKHKKAKIIMVGLNYYLYYECIKRYNLNQTTVISEVKDRVAPTLEEIKVKIEKENPQLVVLTLPLNPSGEIYTEEELRGLISFLKSKNIMLLIDKCQMDEFATIFNFVNINKIIIEENYINNIVIINSFSKTRSLPGARLGYIVANKEIITYVNYLNEIYYFNPSAIYITPIAIDLLSRIMFLKDENREKKMVIKIFRYTAINLVPKEIYNRYSKYTVDIICDAIKGDLIKEFYSEINNNYKVIYKNYEYTKERLKEHIHSITKLQGGFNFCIKIKNTSRKNQVAFCEKIKKSTGICLLPECFYYNNEIIENNEPFWIRITAALPEEKFCQLIEDVASFLDSQKL